MTIIRVVGPKYFNNYKVLSEYLDGIIPNKDTRLITSGKKGIDRLVERYCIENDYILIFYIDKWLKYKKRAKMIVNREMVYESDIVVAFLTGEYSQSTELSVSYAINMNKLIYRVNCEKDVPYLESY